MKWLAELPGLPAMLGNQAEDGEKMKTPSDKRPAKGDASEAEGAHKGLLRRALAAATRAEAREVAALFAPPAPPERPVVQDAQEVEWVWESEPAADGSVQSDSSPESGLASRAADGPTPSGKGTVTDAEIIPLPPPSALLSDIPKHLRAESKKAEITEPRRQPRKAADPPPLHGADEDETPRTQLIRGKRKVTRGIFHQDPVVGWLVVVGGPGLGAFRPIFEGNNTLGRSPSQRIPIDFGDDTISSEEQAYIRYDSGDRTYLLIPNLAKTNIVTLNDKKPTAAAPLQAMDLITVGRTQLVFVPFCGPEFDWGDLGER